MDSEMLDMTCNNTMIEDTLEKLATMRMQEESAYFTVDFLRQQSRNSMLNVDIDEDCRTKMCDWCYQVVDFCKFSRESVEIAMSYLDRFMATPAGAASLADRTVYQLASMATLYTAVKINEPKAMDPKLVSSLSRGAYTAEEIVAMESLILQSLQWRMSPPTTCTFLRLFLELIPESTVSLKMKEYIYESSVAQTEVAISDYAFVGVNASTLAYCSIMNALEYTTPLDDTTLGYIGYILAQAIGIKCNDMQVMKIQMKLYRIVFAYREECASPVTVVDHNCHQRSCKQIIYEQHQNKNLEIQSLEESPRGVSNHQRRR